MMSRLGVEAKRSIAAIAFRISGLTGLVGLSVTLLACAVRHQPSGNGFTLISPVEYRQLQAQAATHGNLASERQFKELRVPDPKAPRIIIEAPDPGSKVVPPIRLVIRFVPSSDARIDVSSFQVIYKLGFLHKDITDRIRPFVVITAQGVTGVSSSSIPVGEHTLIIRIRDTLQRLGEKSVTFDIT